MCAITFQTQSTSLTSCNEGKTYRKPRKPFTDRWSVV